MSLRLQSSDFSRISSNFVLVFAENINSVFRKEPKTIWINFKAIFDDVCPAKKAFMLTRISLRPFKTSNISPVFHRILFLYLF